ncbi:rod shape-determining protein MreD [Euzebya sp.]|uniref:rod shape-determining protein MreD n=1 Tax=Euzebya sp. TaxID=1971409 RepID=UPI003513C82F
MGVRVAAFGVMILLAILLKTTVLPAVAVAGFRPDVLVLVVVAIGLAEGPESGVRVGFAAGLVQDLISGGSALVGVGALVVMGAGYAAGRLRPYIAASAQTGPIVLSGGLTAAATAAFGMLGRMFGTTEPTLGRVLVATLVVGLYSAVVSPLVLRPVRSVLRQFPPASAG